MLTSVVSAHSHWKSSWFSDQLSIYVVFLLLKSPLHDLVGTQSIFLDVLFGTRLPAVKLKTRMLFRGRHGSMQKWLMERRKYPPLSFPWWCKERWDHLGSFPLRTQLLIHYLTREHTSTLCKWYSGSLVDQIQNITLSHLIRRLHAANSSPAAKTPQQILSTLVRPYELSCSLIQLYISLKFCIQRAMRYCEADMMSTYILYEYLLRICIWMTSDLYTNIALCLIFPVVLFFYLTLMF